MEYSEYHRIARENLSENWGKSVGVTFVAALLGGVLVGNYFNFNLELDAEQLQRLPEIVVAFLAAWASVASFISFVHFIIGGTIQLGYSQILLKQYHRQEFETGELFSQFHRFKQGFLQSLLRNLYIALWSLLFIIPGIVKSYAYAMTPFIMADHPDMTAQDAITASKELMEGHKGELFMLGLTFIGWDILAGLSLGIGHLWLSPYKNAVYAVFYRELCTQKRIN